jgi:hypothetical protein
MASVQIEPFTFTCINGNCPTIWRTDRGTYVIQGYAVADAGITPPAGELLVEVPAELLAGLQDDGRA